MSVNYVFIHGSWHGAWCWERVERILDRAGHRTKALTLVGLGERVAELEQGIDLRVQAEDLVQQLITLRWQEITLVAHSYAGMLVAWIADDLYRLGVKRLVLVDAFVPFKGECALDVAPSLKEPLMGLRMKEKPWLLAAPPPALFGISDAGLAAEVELKLSPMPLATHTQKLNEEPQWNSEISVSYIRCTEFQAFGAMKERVRGRKGWHWHEIRAGHDVMLIRPDELRNMLGQLAS